MQREANLLAHRYKRARKESTKEKYFNKLYKMLEPVIFTQSRKYSQLTHDKIDYWSVANIALLAALNTYDITKGNFDSHYLTRVRSEVSREAIKFSGKFRLPDNVGKKHIQISSDDRDLIASGEDKELIMLKYNLDNNMYDSLSNYYKEIPNHFLHTETEYTEDLDRFELPEIIDSALSELKPTHKVAICRYFGILGYDKMSAGVIKHNYGIEVNEIIKELRNNQFIREMLEDYYV